MISHDSHSQIYLLGMILSEVSNEHFSAKADFVCSLVVRGRGQGFT